MVIVCMFVRMNLWSVLRIFVHVFMISILAEFCLYMCVRAFMHPRMRSWGDDFIVVVSSMINLCNDPAVCVSDIKFMN